jgi:L-amino acid N-acyltransferase YncA
VLVLIRVAGDDDWPSIFPIFDEITRAGETYAYPVGLSSDAAKALWMGDPVVVVALLDGAIAGTAKMGPNRPGAGAHIATASFMVGSGARGRGVGRALAGYVIDRARSEGYRGIQFNAVVETNTAAVTLWTSLGFETVGTVPGAFRHPTAGYVGLHVMFMPLTRPIS